ncbi:ABC transporter permease subunit [Streptomyces sp. NPDC060194]|uniref:ABC transporter permease subunit n=1 Tax=Streptomyces sp. NPDC060194 TaxID=3347069 RepID=UPI003667F454
MSVLALKGMPRTVARLHRTALIFTLLCLLALAGATVWLYSIGDEARLGERGCASPPTDGLPSCERVWDNWASGIYSPYLALATTAVSYLVFPVAAWAGAALIGRELENGTARLTWTQSITPTRWLTAKLALPALVLTACVTTAVLLLAWARRDGDPNHTGDWYMADHFIVRGPVAVALVLAGLALGALAGVLTRRTLPALGLGFGLALVLYNVLERYRESLWPTATRITASQAPLPRDAWPIGSGIILSDGTRRSGYFNDCTGIPVDMAPCAPSGARFLDEYHPASHLLPLHLVETGILLAVTAAATTAAFVLIRRRTA